MLLFSKVTVISCTIPNMLIKLNTESVLSTYQKPWCTQSSSLCCCPFKLNYQDDALKSVIVIFSPKSHCLTSVFVCPKEKDVCPPVCPPLSVCSVVTLKDSWLKHFKKLKEGVSANTRSLPCPASSLTDPPLSCFSCLSGDIDRFPLSRSLPLDSRSAFSV